jgi:hypothetical protein
VDVQQNIGFVKKAFRYAIALNSITRTIILHYPGPCPRYRRIPVAMALNQKKPCLDIYVDYTTIYERTGYLFLSIQAIEREIASPTRALVAMLVGFELSSMLLDALKTSIKSMIKSVATIKLNKALFVDKTLLLGKLFIKFIFIYK